MLGRGLVRGRGCARFKNVVLGGPRARAFRFCVADPSAATEVHMFRDSSMTPLLMLRQRLGAVHSLLESIRREGFSLSRSLELHAPCGCILRHGPSGPLGWDDLDVGAHLGLDVFARRVPGSLDKLARFVHGVVVHRRQSAIGGWRGWLLEDPLVHPQKWLRPDSVPPSPFLSCDPKLKPGGSGVLTDPERIDEQFRDAWLPFFCRAGVAGAVLTWTLFVKQLRNSPPFWTRLICLPLLVVCFFECVQKKRPTAASLNGWG